MRLEGLRSVPLKTRIFANTQPIVAVQFAPGTNIPVLRSDWTRSSSSSELLPRSPSRPSKP